MLHGAREPDVWITANDSLALTRLLWDLAETAEHDAGVHAYHWAAQLESAAGVPGWPGSPLGDADCIAYLEATAAHLQSGDAVESPDRIGLTRAEAADLAALLWTLSTTATTHPNRMHAYHWARFLDVRAGTQPASSDHQHARMRAATAIHQQIEAIRRQRGPVG